MTQPHVVIAGAGIGGLTAALTLHARGINATVIERAEQLKPLGVGVNLLPHAVRELYALGLRDDLARIAMAPTAICYYDTQGTLLFRELRGIEGGYDWPQLSVHRGELQMILLSAVRDRLGPASVRTGTGLMSFAESSDHVVARTYAGDIAADALIGADGLHSVVRAQLHPAADPLLWSGVRMWRGASAVEPFLDGHTMAIVKGDCGVDLVVYPIGAGLVNWVVLVTESEPAPLPGGAKWNQPGDPAQVLRHLRDWNLDWLDVCELINRADTVLEYPMVDRDVLPWWGRGRVTLLGDAAHPMYPVGANGGSQAIVDARVVAEELDNNFVGGLRAYEANRHAATAGVVMANREMRTAGATQRPDDLARVTANYRRDTHPDPRRPATVALSQHLGHQEAQLMPTPNLFIVYVTDIDRAVAFYSNLFDMQPVVRTPRYVPFDLGNGILFALWNAYADKLTGNPVRTSEVGLRLPGMQSSIDDCYQAWLAKGVTVVEEPHDDVFGRTFVITDPDGNLIRVSPVD